VRWSIGPAPIRGAGRSSGFFHRDPIANGARGISWGLSVFWFAASYGILNPFSVPAAKVSEVFLVLAGLTFGGEDPFFVILDAIL